MTDTPKLKIGIQTIAEIASESVPVIYDAIHAGHLETFLVGRRRFATPKAVERWVNFLKAESDAGRPVSYRARRDENRPAKLTA